MQIDGRRLIRPFFMSKDGKSPTANKRYYDVFTWFITQFAFCFVTAPFNLLTFSSALKVWARVDFYGLVGVAFCFAFLYSPGRAMLASKLRKRNGLDGKPSLERQVSHDSSKMPPGGTLGLPDDPERELQDLVKEVQEEVARRRRRGSNVPDVKTVLQQKIDEVRKMGISIVDGGKKIE
jgi:lysophospholipid acyltransferase